MLALPVLVVALWLIASLIGAWEVLGDPVRLLALIAVLAVIVRGALKSRRLRVPTRSDALRRLEQTAGLEHRPLDTLQDAAVVSPRLWPAHVRRAKEQADTITRVGRTPALTPIDRYGLRIIAPIALIIALVLAWGVGAERLRRSLSPSALPLTNPNAVRFEAWIDPPEYTGRPPVYAQGAGTLNAPIGSTLVIRASGAKGLPRPKYTQADPRVSKFIDLRRLGDQAFDARTTVDGAATLDWRIGWRRKTLQIETIPDAVPEIEITTPPEADKRDRLVVGFSASDDYGVERVVLEMVELTDDVSADTLFDDNVMQAETDAGAFKDAEERELKLDLTRHPLAGRKVAGRLVAIDGAKQRGVSEPAFFTVPDKIFVEPLAKAIMEQRALLIAGTTDNQSYAPMPTEEPDLDASDGEFDTDQSAWRLDRAPAQVRRTAELIRAVTQFPDPGVFNDPVVYMGLRHVDRGLRYARSVDELSGLPDHMWSLALRAEFGVLGTALQEMREAEAALREGIARRAPQREVDTLFTRYNEAVDAYMEELRKNATVGEEQEGGGGGSMGSTDEIQELLDAIEEANRIGDTEGARIALAQLAELLENMQIQLNPGGEGGDGEPSENEMTEELREQLEELAELLGDQRDLQDETRQAEREELAEEFGAEPSPGEGSQQGEPSGNQPGSQSGGRSGSESGNESGNESGREPGDSGEDSRATGDDLSRRQAELQALVDGLFERLNGETARGEDGDEPGAGGEETGEEGSGGGEEDPDGQPGPGAQIGEGISDEAREQAGSAFGQAGEAMRRSEDALGSGELGDARQAQSDAIAALREAAEILSEEIGRLGEEEGEGTGEGEDGEGGVDALGRSNDGFNDQGADIDIDARDNAQRAREILEELRRRASEAERTPEEQEYLDRLLKRF